MSSTYSNRRLTCCHPERSSETPNTRTLERGDGCGGGNAGVLSELRSRRRCQCQILFAMWTRFGNRWPNYVDWSRCSATQRVDSGRDDLSMAEKFDLIAKVEEGANPIELGLAAPAEGSGVTPEQMEHASRSTYSYKGSLSEAAQNYTTSPAAAVAVALMSSQTDAWGLIQSGSINTRDPLFIEAMALGMEASHHIHDIAAGGIDETTLTNEDLRAIPVLKPPKRSFCPKVWFGYSFPHHVAMAKMERPFGRSCATAGPSGDGNQFGPSCCPLPFSNSRLQKQREMIWLANWQA